MERKFHQDDFDQFLKDNADDLRMKPSAAVWENISKELNRKKRRVAALLLAGVMLLSGGLFTWYTLTLPDEKTAGVPQLPTQQIAIPAQTNPALFVANNNAATGAITETAPVVAQIAIRKSSVQRNDNKAITESTPGLIAQNIITTLPATSEQTTSVDLAAAATRNSAVPAHLLQAERTGMQPRLHGVQQSTFKANAPAATEEPAIATAPKAQKRRLLSWSIFATPTVSYRKLSENKTFERPFLTPGTPPMVSALYNINNAVIHKPDLGLEFGVAAKYALTNKLKLRSGFQFNISRYDIKAFSYIPEVATIALSNGFGVDSVRAVSNYRNFNNGSMSNWLQNMYFQASLPVGLEYEVVGNKKVKWNVAAAIQPTYIIGNRSYMITADYKNYARVPWLTRHWNMNTNVETFITFQSGKNEWHIGPQMRYQALSSFVKKYPVKENLFDFGMKVGVTIR
ncbi:hypothetical protein [Paracnuella aquatica]|uniref:hypothetical protein n=1 Tax=Paracnuella aquatica TaxID=2268757 RepID=UPI000DEFC3A6|nr:hypothetical protein [Paracnuella aquatica]RPD45623.1 hypothetical protein DRJ53_15605 [Paracnuella aquatica]